MASLLKVKSFFSSLNFDFENRAQLNFSIIYILRFRQFFPVFWISASTEILMPAIDCTRSTRTKFEIMYSAAFNNIPALFTPDHISHYFHHARHPQSIIGAHIIF